MTGAMVLGKKTIQIDGTERRLIADHRNQPRSRNWGAGGRGRLHGLLVAAHQIRVSWGEVFSHSLTERRRWTDAGSLHPRAIPIPERSSGSAAAHPSRPRLPRLPAILDEPSKP